MNAQLLEKKTIEKMIQIYCDQHHDSNGLCDMCEGLLAYTYERIDKCPYWPMKPACSKCQSHCYSRSNRRIIKGVMSYAGPRMIYRSPILVIRHYIGRWFYNALLKRQG